MYRNLMADSASPKSKIKYGMGTVSPLLNMRLTCKAIVKIVELTSGSPMGFNPFSHFNRDVIIESILHKGKQVGLSKPIRGVFSFTDKLYSLENKELGIFSVNKDPDECLREFESDVSFVLSEYGEESEDRLTDDAKQLKRKILHYVKV